MHTRTHTNRVIVPYEYLKIELLAVRKKDLLGLKFANNERISMAKLRSAKLTVAHRS